MFGAALFRDQIDLEYLRLLIKIIGHLAVNQAILGDQISFDENGRSDSVCKAGVKNTLGTDPACQQDWQ